MSWDVLTDRGLEFSNKLIVTTKVVTIFALVFLVYSAEPHWSISNSVVKRYKSTKILGGGPPGKIVQCQSFNCQRRVGLRIRLGSFLFCLYLCLKIILKAKLSCLKDSNNKTQFDIQIIKNRSRMSYLVIREQKNLEGIFDSWKDKIRN